MAGRFGSIVTMAVMASVVVAQNQGCVIEASDGQPGGLNDLASVHDYLASVGPNVVVPSVDRYLDAVLMLEESLVDHRLALSSKGDSEQTKLAAQQRWLEAMAIWQEIEVMQFGPAGSSLRAIEGQDLRDEIYSWPTVNGCRVDQRTADETWSIEGYFEENLVNAYGMDALEHLLFASTHSECPSQVVPVSDGTWEAMGSHGIDENRADFALVLTDELFAQAERLRNVWAPEGGNFSGALASAGDGSPYESRVVALNEVFNALFYLETVTKDLKLATPMGVLDCPTGVCVEALEGLKSGSSVNAIVGNLRGFKAVFTGGEGLPGMDDVLVEAGHEDLAMQVVEDVDAAISLAQAMELGLDEAIIAEPESVEALYMAVKMVCDALKGDVVTILSMEIPNEAKGDND